MWRRVNKVIHRVELTLQLVGWRATGISRVWGWVRKLNKVCWNHTMGRVAYPRTVVFQWQNQVKIGPLNLRINPALHFFWTRKSFNANMKPMFNAFLAISVRIVTIWKGHYSFLEAFSKYAKGLLFWTVWYMHFWRQGAATQAFTDWSPDKNPDILISPLNYWSLLQVSLIWQFPYPICCSSNQMWSPW